MNLSGIKQGHRSRPGHLFLPSFSQAVAMAGYNHADNVQIVMEMFREMVTASKHPANVNSRQGLIPVISDIGLGSHGAGIVIFFLKVL
jgi:hypothetical protein